MQWGWMTIRMVVENDANVDRLITHSLYVADKNRNNLLK